MNTATARTPVDEVCRKIRETVQEKRDNGEKIRYIAIDSATAYEIVALSDADVPAEGTKPEFDGIPLRLVDVPGAQMLAVVLDREPNFMESMGAIAHLAKTAKSIRIDMFEAISAMESARSVLVNIPDCEDAIKTVDEQINALITASRTLAK